jgi:hypothetical protein
MSKNEEIKSSLDWLNKAADEGRIKAYLTVTIHTDSTGRIVPEVSAYCPDDVDQARIDTIMQCLHGIAEALRSVYDPPVVYSGGVTQTHSRLLESQR